jgi:hypothetical protein
MLECSMFISITNESSSMSSMVRYIFVDPSVIPFNAKLVTDRVKISQVKEWYNRLIMWLDMNDENLLISIEKQYQLTDEQKVALIEVGISLEKENFDVAKFRTTSELCLEEFGQTSDRTLIVAVPA